MASITVEHLYVVTLYVFNAGMLIYVFNVFESIIHTWLLRKGVDWYLRGCVRHQTIHRHGYT